MAAVVTLIFSHLLVTSALRDRTDALSGLTKAMGKLSIEEQNARESLADRIKPYQELQNEQNKTKEALQRESEAINEVTAANRIRKTQSQMLQERQRTLYRSMLKLAHEQALGNNILLADKNLESIPEELRGWEWRYAKRLCHPDVLTMHGHGSVAFAPDGKHAVTCIEDRVELFKIPSGEVATVMKAHTGQDYRVAVSPFGNHIASAAADNKVRVWNAETGGLIATLESPSRVYDVAFSPAGIRSSFSFRMHWGRVCSMSVLPSQFRLGLHRHAAEGPLFLCQREESANWRVGPWVTVSR